MCEPDQSKTSIILSFILRIPLRSLQPSLLRTVISQRPFFSSPELGVGVGRGLRIDGCRRGSVGCGGGAHVCALLLISRVFRS